MTGEAATSSTRDIQIPATDGFALAATVYEPDALTKKVVLITGGTGVLRRFYDPFACFLQQQGFGVVTFDYRGMGDSRPPSLKGFSARMHEWGQQDIAGVLHWIEQEMHLTRTFILGHSAGGQLIGLAPNCDRVDAVVMVTTPSGYWKHWSPRQRLRLGILWHLVMPLLSRVFGYFPSKVVGLGEALPKGVALQWASWCRHPRYLFGSGEALDLSRYRTLAIPMLAYSFEDDTLAPRPSVEALLREYPAAAVTHQHIVPGAINEARIGHFGFFHTCFRETLWQETVAWLKQH